MDREKIKDYMPIAWALHKLRNKKLKNHDFTLFTPNCWGGACVSHNRTAFFVINDQHEVQYDS